MDRVYDAPLTDGSVGGLATLCAVVRMIRWVKLSFANEAGRIV